MSSDSEAAVGGGGVAAGGNLSPCLSVTTPQLPEGWKREVRTRANGSTKGKRFVVLVRYVPAHRLPPFAPASGSLVSLLLCLMKHRDILLIVCLLFSPNGKHFDRRSELEKYLKAHGDTYDTNQFNFSVNVDSSEIKTVDTTKQKKKSTRSPKEIKPHKITTLNSKSPEEISKSS